MIVVWSDYVSPYAFVAKAGAYALEADYEVELQRRPYTLDVASFMGPVEERDPIIGAACVTPTWTPGASPTSRASCSRDRRRSIMRVLPMPACSMPRATACSAATTISPLTASGRRELDPENVDAVAEPKGSPASN